MKNSKAAGKNQIDFQKNGDKPANDLRLSP
jgi:hypothetical protein